MAFLTADPDVDPRLVRWERNTRWLIVLAAVIPLFGALGGGDADPHGGQVVIDFAAWAIFLADLVVHLRFRRRYLRTRWGMVDLAIVVLTFPWYLVPGLGAGEILVVARLGRLARIVALAVKGGVARVFLRLGKTAIFACLLVIVAAIIVQRVEPASSGFTSFGNSIWWAVVTITTVGYGDLVPVTVEGRIAAGVLMVGGLAVLGTIAATLASYIQGQDDSSKPAADEINLQTVLAEIRELHTKLDALQEPEPPPR